MVATKVDCNFSFGLFLLCFASIWWTHLILSPDYVGLNSMYGTWTRSAYDADDDNNWLNDRQIYSSDDGDGAIDRSLGRDLIARRQVRILRHYRSCAPSAQLLLYNLPANVVVGHRMYLFRSLVTMRRHTSHVFSFQASHHKQVRPAQVFIFLRMPHRSWTISAFCAVTATGCSYFRCCFCCCGWRFFFS